MRSTATLANMKSSSTRIWDLRSSARTRHSEVIIFKDFNSLTPGRCGNDFKLEISEHILQGYVHEHFLWNCSQAIAIEYFSWHVNIGSGNGLVPSGNKPLPPPMLTQIYVTIWPQWVISGVNNPIYSFLFFFFLLKKLAMMTDIIIIIILSQFNHTCIYFGCH